MDNFDTTLSGVKGPPPENQTLELTRMARAGARCRGLPRWPRAAQLTR